MMISGQQTELGGNQVMLLSFCDAGGQPLGHGLVDGDWVEVAGAHDDVDGLYSITPGPEPYQYVQLYLDHWIPWASWPLEALAFVPTEATMRKIFWIEDMTGPSDAVKIKKVGHTLADGKQVTVHGVEGNTAANGTWTVLNSEPPNDWFYVLDENNDYVTGNGEYVPRGNPDEPTEPPTGGLYWKVGA